MAPIGMERREGETNRADETAKAKTNKKENILLIFVCETAAKRWGENSSLRFAFLFFVF